MQTDYSPEMARGIPGNLDTSSPKLVATMKNDEATLAVPFGGAVSQGTATDKNSALTVDNTADKVVGLVAYTGAYDDTQIDATGPLPGETLSVARKGRMLVVCEDGASPGDRLFVRATGAGARGALRSAADGVNTIDMTHAGEWEEEIAAGAMGYLNFDFTRQA